MARRRTENLKARLQMRAQGHVFRYWDELSDESRKKFLDQLESFDMDLVAGLVGAQPAGPQVSEATGPADGAAATAPDGGRTEAPLAAAPAGAPGPGEIGEPEVIALPTTAEDHARREDAAERGLAAMRAGRVAALVVAGGQGTRLGFDGPKGCFPIGPVTNRSLFKLHAEKILAASRRAGRPIPWYIMTSEANERATRDFLRGNDYFGLDPEDVFIFRQGMMPAVTPEGKLILEDKDRVFTAPNGHGGVFRALADSGALDDLVSRGIEELYYFQVDNPLVPVPDPVFLGFHMVAGAQMSSKVLRKRAADEPIGTLVKRLAEGGGRVEVVEYSDIPPEVENARLPDGQLRWPWGSIAIHAISVAFARRIVEGGVALPFHRAKKKIPYLDEQGQKVTPVEPNGVKFEMFVFDALGLAERSVALEVDRQSEFAPVKNAEGADSVLTARRALSELYAGWLQAAGVEVAREADGSVAGAVEISPLVADSAAALKAALPPETRFRDGLVI